MRTAKLSPYMVVEKEMVSFGRTMIKALELLWLEKTGQSYIEQ